MTTVDLRVVELSHPAVLVDRDDPEVLRVVISAGISSEALARFATQLLSVEERNLVRAHMGRPSVEQQPLLLVPVADIGVRPAA